MITFTIQYKNPYINVYIKASDINDEITEGYIDYQGNLNPYSNDNFRLYLHQFLYSWCILGSTDTLIYDTYSSYTGILFK